MLYLLVLFQVVWQRTKIIDVSTDICFMLNEDQVPFVTSLFELLLLTAWVHIQITLFIDFLYTWELIGAINSI